jgi:hypothetical protein
MLVLHVFALVTLRPAGALFGFALAYLRPVGGGVLGFLAIAVARPAGAVFGFLADVSVNPTSSGMPGASFAQTLIDWTGQIALWGSLISILIGAAIYGLSQHVGNTYGASKGRLLALAGSIGAGLTGLAPTLVNLLHSAASK